MSHDEKSPDQNLPSYEDSITTRPFVDNRADGQRILDQLTTARAQNIRLVVDAQIYPIIERRAERGISQTVLALIPSSILKADDNDSSEYTRETSSDTAVEVHGLVSVEDMQQIQLQGDSNHFEFWQQKDVVYDLQRVLQERLSSSPIFSGDTKDSGIFANPLPERTSPPTAQKTRFFGRRISKSAVQQTSQASNAAQPIRSPHFEVKVGLEEVCLRTVSFMGLYATITKPAVIVRVTAKC